jgi:ABC-2 type transport system permease protein
MYLELIGAKLRTVKGNLRSSQGERHRGPLFIILSVIFSVMLFRGSYWLVSQALEVQPIGELLVAKLVSLAFLIFLGMLVFSNVVAAFTTFYLADDMDFLMAQPVSWDALFASRYTEALVQSSWVIVLFGMPPFTALGYAMGASWSYYIMLLVVFLPFVAIPTGLASLACLLVTNMLIASRMRDTLGFLGMVALVLLFYGIRALQPEKLFNPDSFDSLGEMINLLSTPPSSWLPSDWAINVLSPMIFQQGDIDLWSLALLYTTPSALFFISAWLHRKFFYRGYTRVQEGRHGESVLTVLRDKMLQQSTQRGGGVTRKLEQLKERAGESFGPMQQLIIKDRLIFTRDASQWSNMLVIVAMMIIYLVNFKYFEIASGTAFFGEVGLYYFNMAICGFVVVALSGRFLFPSVSIEGRSFWLMMQAPISLEQMLVGKWIGAMAPVIFVGQFVIWASNILISQNWGLTLIAATLVLIFSVCVAGISVGLGAVYPQFYNPNASSIAASFGAIIFMISSIILVLMSLFFSFRFVQHMTRVIEGTHELELTMNMMLGLGVAILLPTLAAYAAIRLGAASLRKRM